MRKQNNKLWRAWRKLAKHHSGLPASELLAIMNVDQLRTLEAFDFVTSRNGWVQDPVSGKLGIGAKRYFAQASGDERCVSCGSWYTP